MNRRGAVRTQPCHALFGGIVGGGVAGIENGNKAQHTVMCGSAASAADGDRGGIAAVVIEAGQGRNEVLPDL